MSKIIEMQEKRANVAKELQGLTDKIEKEARGFDATENETWDKLTDEYNSLDGAITKIEEARKLNLNVAKDLQEARKDDLSDEERYAKAFTSYITRGLQGMEAEERNLIITRSQSTGTNTEGGFLTHTEFVARVDEAMKAYGGMREVATIMQTETGSDLLLPTFDDTANTGKITAENADVGTDDLAFGQTSIGAFMYTSGVYLVPLQLLQDSKIDIQGMIASAIGTRIARKQNTDFTVGDGTAKPSGIMTGATSGITTAGIGAVSYADLVDLQHSVDSLYRNNAKWMFNDTTLGALRKLVDGNGMPLWGMKDLTNGEASTILGKSYQINNDMTDIATSATPIVFGDLSKYMIRDVADLSLQRFDEKYMNQLQVGFMGYRRSGGGVWDAGTAFKAMTIQ